MEKGTNITLPSAFPTPLPPNATSLIRRANSILGKSFFVFRECSGGMNYSEMALDSILHNSTLEIEGRDDMSDTTHGTRNTQNHSIVSWVERIAQICQPQQVFWCDWPVAAKEFLTPPPLER